MKAVLFDADGVIQSTPPAFLEAIGNLPDASEDAAAFVSEIFTAERRTLTGEADFPGELAGILARWGVSVPVDEALLIWSMIDPLPGVRELVESVSVPCYLASNQQRHRGEYMSRELGYGSLFAAEFYSYQLGVMKPELDYFAQILSSLACSPAEVLFIDDAQKNVAAAERLGMAGAVFDLREHDRPLEVLTDVLNSHGVPVG